MELIDRILDEFKDINYAYNDSARLDTLSRMLDELVEQTAAPRWVRCEDELPVKGEIVIVSDGKRTWDVGQYRLLVSSDDRTKWWWKGHTIKTVKWWMRKKDALPEPPREGED